MAATENVKSLVSQRNPTHEPHLGGSLVVIKWASPESMCGLFLFSAVSLTIGSETRRPAKS